MNTLLLDRVDPGIAVVTFNRPERLNAMSGEMMDELQQLWIDLAAEPDLTLALGGEADRPQPGGRGEPVPPRGQIGGAHV